MEPLELALERMKALQAQILAQQGLGRPIITAVFNGYRIVVVGKRLLYSKSWKTFHDFLFEYIVHLFGSEWFKEATDLPALTRHPLIEWLEILRKHQEVHTDPRKAVQSATLTGAGAAYLGLSYNLYLLAHNVELQERLMKRLKNPEQFFGANYETYVAAAFIKSGFRIELEPEEESDISHVEFNATYPHTGSSFSVEAKARALHKTSTSISDQLYKALRKDAKYRRVVFIEMSMPDRNDGQANVDFMESAVQSLRNKELKLTIAGQPAPEAYVFITNHPYHFLLDEEDFRVAVYARGFKIQDFGIDAKFRNLHEALIARDRHIEMFRLMDSMRDHFDIPSTFEGEIPEFSIDSDLPRLMIGNTYLVPLESGKEVPGTLVEACVFEEEKSVWGVYRLEDGKHIKVITPISDAELSAYHRYPDTFFGIFRKQGRNVNTIVEFYDFLYETYSKSERSVLLGFLKDYPNQEKLMEMSQQDLARLYCELIAESNFRRPT